MRPKLPEEMELGNKLPFMQQVVAFSKEMVHCIVATVQ